jgi:hypothetical protein
MAETPADNRGKRNVAASRGESEEKMTGEIETVNDQLVGDTAGGNITVQMPKNLMTRAEALRHAAWIVALADPLEEEFPAVLAAVRST